MSIDLVVPRAHARFGTDNAGPTGSHPVAPRRAGGRGRILLAGSDEAQGRMIGRALEADGYDVVAHRSGRDSVLALVAEPADLLLVNAPLQDGSASALVRWARARRASSHMTCMVMVSPDEDQLVAGLYDAGADLVLTRRMQLHLLSRQVGAALARRPLALAS